MIINLYQLSCVIDNVDICSFITMQNIILIKENLLKFVP